MPNRATIETEQNNLGFSSLGQANQTHDIMFMSLTLKLNMMSWIFYFLKISQQAIWFFFFFSCKLNTDFHFWTHCLISQLDYHLMNIFTEKQITDITNQQPVAATKLKYFYW